MLLALNGINGTTVNYLSQPATIHQPALVPALDHRPANFSRFSARALPRLEIKDEVSLLQMIKLPLLPAAFSNRPPTQAPPSFAQTLTENTSDHHKSNELATSSAPRRTASAQAAGEESSNETSNESSGGFSSESHSTWSCEPSRLDNASSPRNEFNKFYDDSSEGSSVSGMHLATGRPNSQTSNEFANGSHRFDGSVGSDHGRSNINSLNSNTPAMLLASAQLAASASEPIASPPLHSLSSSTTQQTYSPLQPKTQSTQSIALLISASKPLTDLLNTTKLPIKPILTTKNNETMQKSLNSTLGAVGSTIAYEYPAYIRNTATVIFIIILIFGTIGNILVSVIIIRSKDLRNTTNYFLINLSIADLLVIIVCMPTVLIELHSKPEIWLLGEFMCK